MIAVDLFAGGGGASVGIQLATGVCPVIAVNHDPAAVEMHAANHPNTTHLCESVFDVRPREVVGAVPVDLLWASPDCTHFSRAKGGKPRDKRIRGLAWVIVDWCREVHPRVVAMENVPEFVTWGPVDDDGQVIASRKGETFREFVGALRELGYTVDWQVLKCSDYGLHTTRERFFLVARRDGLPVSWPTPTGEVRTAAECIDWSIPMLSIFATPAEAKAWAKAVGAEGVPKRPLAEATQRRIAEGLRKFVVENPRPYIVNLSHGGRLEDVDQPMRTITATPKGGDRAIVAPWLVNTRNGERLGRAPRVRDLNRPLGTVTAQGSQGAVCAAFIAKHNGSGERWAAAIGQSLAEPMHTITSRDTKALVAAFLTKFYGQGSQAQALDEPLHTIVTKARFGLVTVEIDGETYAVVDIAMRMLAPRELLRAQFGPDLAEDYILTGTKEEQVARIGNSVPPRMVEAILRANGFNHGQGEQQRGLFDVMAAK
jgi:DNA (cytosine-5)-methyltransferase 1